MTSIQWTDVTDNPIAVKDGGWFCQKISPGCANCYAESWNGFRGNKQPYAGKPPELLLKHDLIASWTKSRKPKLHFVASMTDVFGEWVPPAWQFEILDGMTAAPKQTFQVLTKRPEVMKSTIAQWLTERSLDKLPDNIWVGASVENQKCADIRIPELIQIPARIRFLSCEPLLEHIQPKLDGIHWAIVGGESGHKARPMNVAWMRSIIIQCRQSGTACFVKQLGSNPVFGTDEPTRLFFTGKAGDMGEWSPALRVREMPEVKSA